MTAIAPARVPSGLGSSESRWALSRCRCVSTKPGSTSRPARLSRPRRPRARSPVAGTMSVIRPVGEGEVDQVVGFGGAGIAQAHPIDATDVLFRTGYGELSLAQHARYMSAGVRIVGGRPRPRTLLPCRRRPLPTLARSSPTTAGGCARCSATRGAAAGSPRRSRSPGTRTTRTGWSPTRRSTTPRSAGPTCSGARRRSSSRSARASVRPRLRWRPRVRRTTSWRWRCGGPGSRTPWAWSREAGADNVRLLSVDAVWALRHLFGSGEVEELWTFFPDPWPKKRHHKRRLVTPEFAALAASRLRPDGVVAAGHGLGGLRRADARRPRRRAAPRGRPVDRWAERPVTKFERKGRDADREIVDLAYRRRSGRCRSG